MGNRSHLIITKRPKFISINTSYYKASSINTCTNTIIFFVAIVVFVFSENAWSSSSARNVNEVGTFLGYTPQNTLTGARYTCFSLYHDEDGDIYIKYKESIILLKESGGIEDVISNLYIYSSKEDKIIHEVKDVDSLSAADSYISMQKLKELPRVERISNYYYDKPREFNKDFDQKMLALNHKRLSRSDREMGIFDFGRIVDTQNSWNTRVQCNSSVIDGIGIIDSSYNLINDKMIMYCSDDPVKHYVYPYCDALGSYIQKDEKMDIRCRTIELYDVFYYKNNLYGEFIDKYSKVFFIVAFDDDLSTPYIDHNKHLFSLRYNQLSVIQDKSINDCPDGMHPYEYADYILIEMSKRQK